jgi:hypothetical protein
MSTRQFADPFCMVEYSLLLEFAKSWWWDVECGCSVRFADIGVGFTRFILFEDIFSMQRRIDMLDEIVYIRT